MVKQFQEILDVPLTSTTGQTSFVMTDCTVNLSLSSTVIGRANANSKLFLLGEKR